MNKSPRQTGSIYVTEPDYQRLSGLIEITRDRNGVDREYLDTLEAELARAEIIDPKHIPLCRLLRFVNLEHANDARAPTLSTNS